MESIKVNVLSKGAEAILLLKLWYGMLVVEKIRISKRYRNPHLDVMLRRARTILEARLLHEAKLLGIPVPALIDIDIRRNSLTMEYIPGKRLRDSLERFDKDFIECLFRNIGENVGILHSNGIVHGDLTTSNMILTETGNVYLIDFGLGGHTWDLEDMGTDIHLMLRALESTHTDIADLCFKAFINGYRKIMKDKTGEVLRKVKEIRSRGRYVAVEVRKSWRYY